MPDYMLSNRFIVILRQLYLGGIIMENLNLNPVKGILSKCLKSFCLVVIGVVGVWGDVWGADYTMQNKNGRWNDGTSLWTLSNGRYPRNFTNPGSNDNVTVSQNDKTLTINVNNAQCNNFTFSAGTVAVNTNCSLSVGRTLTMSNNTVLRIDGTATINSISSTNSNQKITGSGTLTIKGGTLNCDLSEFEGILTIDGNVNINNNLTLNNGLTYRSGTITIANNNLMTINGPLAVNNNLTFDNKYNISGVTNITVANNRTLTLSGTNHNFNSNVTLNGNVTFNNNATFSSGLTYSGGTISFGNNGGMTISGPLAVNSNLTLNNKYNVSGVTNLTVNNRTTLTITDNHSFDNLTINGTGTGKVTINNTATINSGLTYEGGTISFGNNGKMVISGTLTVNKSLTLNDNYDVSGVTQIDVKEGETLTLNGSNLQFNQNLTVNGNVAISNNIAFNGNATFNSGLTYNGGTITIANNKKVTIKGNFNVNENLTIDDKFPISHITNITIRNTKTLTLNNSDINFNSISSITGNVVINNANVTLKNLKGCIGGNVTINSENVTYYTNSTYMFPGTYNNLAIDNKITLCGNVTVTGTLTWNNGRILLNNNSFTLERNALITSTSDYDDSHYFAFAHQATTGFVTFKGDLSRLDNDTIIPVGNVNVSSYTYRPVKIKATTTATSSFSVRPTNGISKTEKSTDLQCYWTTESVNISGATLTFTHRPGDYPSSSSIVLKPFCDAGSEWQKWEETGSGYNKSDNTITFTNCTSLTGHWSACEDRLTFYTFTSGNWNNPEIWTLDPSGTIYKNPDSRVPAATDRVEILTGNEVRTEADGKRCFSTTIADGGVLSIGTTTNHDFGQVKGKGKIALASTNFPGGDYSVFVKKNGGIVEYQNTTNFTLPPSRNTYNNLIINIPNGTKSILGSSFKVNGYLKIKSGTFQIGDNSGYGWSIIIEEDVIVDAGASITTSETKVRTNDNSLVAHRRYDVDRDILGHYMVINGDLINNGTVKFTNLTPATAPRYYGVMPNSDYYDSARDHVDVFFRNKEKDQNIVINGLTYFYMIDVDKGGTEQCVNIDAAAENQFYLLGYLYNFPENIDGSIHADQYKEYYHALRLSKGTLRLGENIKIDALQFPKQGNNTIWYNSYLIPETGCLWIDGAEVNVGYTNGNDKTTTFAIYGKLKMTNSKSVLNTNCTNGILWREYGVIEIENGTINTQSINTSVGAGGVDHRGSFVMHGGTINLSDKSVGTNLPIFGMTHSTMSFNMSDGNVNITTNNSANIALAIGIDENNASITGGTFNIITDGDNSTFTSTLPFYNLSVQGTNGNLQTEISAFTRPDALSGANNVAANPLRVLNNLTIENTGYLNTNSNNVTIGGNFTIDENCQYTSGTNTTTFDGNGRTLHFVADGTINNSGLYNLTVEQGTSLIMHNDVAVRGDFSLKSGTSLVDNGKTLSVAGNVENSGTQYNSNGTAGSITLTGSGNQTIGGNGEGVFNNLHINKSGGTVALSANTTVTGYLRLLSNHNLNIGSYNLNLDDDDAAIYSNASSGTDFSNTKMILTAGLSSDGGITKRYCSTQPFLFPYGYDSYYLPASIQVENEPSAFGSVTSHPVKGKHYALEDGVEALGCYWSNSSTGFEGVTNVLHQYNYVDDVINGTETNYIPGCYNPFSWSFVLNSSLVNKAINRITYPDIKIDGDYTCGNENGLNTAPTILYSSSTPGDWSDINSWSTVGVGEPADADAPPGQTTIVFIGDNNGNDHKHTIRMTVGGQSCGSLVIAKGSMLDLGNTNGHNFGVVNSPEGGSGIIRISRSNYFPVGDFGAFLRTGGGTVEYYANNGNITIPATIETAPANYNHLKLTSSNNGYCVLPNKDLHVYGNLISDGGTNDNYNRFNIESNSRTLTIDSNLIVESNSYMNFRSANNYPQNVVVKGNITVKNNAVLGVNNNNNVTNQITIYGNMESNGTITFSSNNQKVATTFTGTANDTIRGTGTINLYTLTCDKGSDATPILFIEKNISTSGSTSFLTLLNGTFRANGGDVNINLTTNNDFTIPSTACLSTQNGTFTVCNSTNGNAKLVLNGKLEVLGGTLNIGNPTTHLGNDIEYNTGTIDVSDGELNVSGQIRRAITLQTGDLTYIQSGGFVYVYGYNRDCEYSDYYGYRTVNTLNRRALFEVCNNGAFITSGGELHIVDNAKPDTWSEYGFGDIIITPASSNVTGGTIFVGGSVANANPFLLNSSINLYNLTIGTETVGQTVKLHVNPLNLLGNLTINSGSTLNAVGHNVFVKGDIYDNSTNGYSATSGQCLTLNGTQLQRIVGTGSNKITVDKITFSNPTKVELSDIKLEAANYLYIERGEVDDGGNLIIAKSDVINDSYHTSSVDGGGIKMDGELQTIRSTSGHIGNYGNLIIESQTTMADNIIVNGLLTLHNILDIGSMQLTMGVEADFDGTFNGNSMVQLTGAIGDLGVKRLLPETSSSTLFFPVGRTRIYSPAQYTFNELSGTDAYVVVKVIGYRHKSIKEIPEGSVDMYWMVSSSGIESGSVTHNYYYDDEDLKDGTDESLLHPRRYLTEVNEWTNYNDVSVTNNTISLSGLPFVDGEYTAGYYSYSCQPPMRSKTSGPWNNISTWEELVDRENDIWGDATSTPNGNPVTITSGTDVNITGNSYAAYSINIENGATLIVGKTSKHNFGRVRGSGAISLKALDAVGDVQSSFKLPAGDYDEFLSNAHSTIIFDNDGKNAWLNEQPGNFYKPFSNVMFTGTGQTTVTAQAFYAIGDVIIDDGCQIDNATNNRPFYVGGNYTDGNTSRTGYISGTSKVIFCGSNAQTVTLGCDASFYDMEINNSSGLTVTGSNIVLSRQLYLTNGVIHTSDNALVKLASSSQNVVTGGSAASHIDGPLSKNILNSGSFTFPVGNDGRFGQITVSNTAGTGYWTAVYYNSNPSALSTTYRSPIVSICDNEYWEVERPAGSTAKIGLRWDSESTPYTNFDMLKARMQIVEYGNSEWAVRESDATGTLASGTITTNTNVTQDDYIFTFGYTGVVATITNTENIEICGNDAAEAVVNVSLSGTAPWTLSYSISDGTNTTEQTQRGILTSSCNLTLVSSDLGDAGTYTVSLLSVSDATSDGIITGDPATIIVKQTYIPVIDGPLAAVKNESRTYSVESHDGSSYSWNLPSGGDIIGSGNSITVNFANSEGNRTLSVTETSAAGCSVTTSITIEVTSRPAPTFDADLNVCVNDVGNYSTAFVSGHSYQWYLDESPIPGKTSNTLTHTWSTAGTYTLKIRETKSGNNYGEFSQQITVFDKPNLQGLDDIDDICAGNKPIVHLNGSELGVSYYLYSGENAISSLVSGTGGAINLTTLNALTETTDIYVVATNLGCNFEQNNYQGSETKTAAVYQLPTISYTMPTLYLGAPSDLVYTETGAEPKKYSIDYVTGGVDVLNQTIGVIRFTPTDEQVTGTFTLASDEGCTASYDFDVAIADGYVWSGQSSSNWSDVGNWYSGAVPNNEHDAIIRTAAKQPVISSTDAQSKSVKIESGVLTITGSKTLEVYGNWQNEVGNEGFVGNSSTVAFKNDAEISGNTTFGSISNASGKTLNITNGHITVNGNISNGGTLSGDEGTTIEMAGSAGAELSAGTYNLANLTINKTAALISNADLNVSGTFAINAGVLTMGTNKVVNLGVDATATSGGETAYVDGTMTKLGSSAITFPIGNNGRRAMVGIEPSGANESTLFTAKYTYTPKNEVETPAEPEAKVDGLKRVSSMDRWDITGESSSYLTLYWDNGTISEIGDPATLVVAHWNTLANQWEMFEANPLVGTTAASGGIKTRGLVSSYSPYAFGATDDGINPLPVELVGFTGRQDGNSVVLEWTTLSEKDNDYFEIERSVDGINFVTIGFVQGAGNSTEKIAYSFADNAPERGLVYYRLSQVDYDGTRSYADRLVSVAYTAGSDISLTIVPNPTRGQFNLRITGATDGIAKLLTQSGKPIRIVDIRNLTESIDISDLPNGIYILQYQTGENVVHERIIKL